MMMNSKCMNNSWLISKMSNENSSWVVLELKLPQVQALDQNFMTNKKKNLRTMMKKRTLRATLLNLLKLLVKWV